MDLVQPAIAVLLVLALLAGSLLLLRRRGIAAFGGSLWVPPGPRRMEIVERLPLGPQHALHMVRVGGRLLLIATTPGSCQIMQDPELPVDEHLKP